MFEVIKTTFRRLNLRRRSVFWIWPVVDIELVLFEEALAGRVFCLYSAHELVQLAPLQRYILLLTFWPSPSPSPSPPPSPCISISNSPSPSTAYLLSDSPAHVLCDEDSCPLKHVRPVGKLVLFIEERKKRHYGNVSVSQTKYVISNNVVLPKLCATQTTPKYVKYDHLFSMASLS